MMGLAMLDRANIVIAFSLAASYNQCRGGGFQYVQDEKSQNRICRPSS